ncbi:hypothetical protein NC651_015066 [Populus alba x Populus x berolinensis]|nr:hypothetical protein NC651_015066 [Populus alba x Populus x berolinensis]
MLRERLKTFEQRGLSNSSLQFAKAKGNEWLIA